MSYDDATKVQKFCHKENEKMNEKACVSTYSVSTFKPYCAAKNGRKKSSTSNKLILYYLSIFCRTIHERRQRELLIPMPT